MRRNHIRAEKIKPKAFQRFTYSTSSFLVLNKRWEGERVKGNEPFLGSKLGTNELEHNFHYYNMNSENFSELRRCVKEETELKETQILLDSNREFF